LLNGIILGVEYVLKYSDSGLKRRKIENNQTHDSCVAFTEEDRILTGAQYNLFSAADGSKLEFESGKFTEHSYYNTFKNKINLCK
jgi:hypothetical protein